MGNFTSIETEFNRRLALLRQMLSCNPRRMLLIHNLLKIKLMT